MPEGKAGPVQVYGLSEWQLANAGAHLASASWNLPAAKPLRRPPARPQKRVQGDLRAQFFGLDDPSIVTEVQVVVDGEEVTVMLDPSRGPRWGLRQGDEDFVCVEDVLSEKMGRGALGPRHHKKWDQLTVTEQESVLVTVAKKLKALHDRGVVTQAPAALESGPELSQEDLAQIRAEAEERCKRELTRPCVPWRPITVETVTQGHAQVAQGMFYSIEFPWTESMLAEWGPQWLTRAFHAAGTLEKDNAVLELRMERKHKITTGNNGGKFLFDVTYARPGPGLHTRLFAKVPFPLEGATRSDRLSSSVNKQPQEYYEINASRLLEGTLPVKMPKFYFGDISNVTSNWILITERVGFDDKAPTNFGRPKGKRQPLPAWKIEGPYDKCLDYNLRGEPQEYYALLVRTGARIAGLHKAGQLGSEEVLKDSFQYMLGLPPEAFRMVPDRASGEDPRTFEKKLEAAEEFISETGRVLFPAYVTSTAFLERFRSTMLTINAYSAELMYWKHRDPDYVALTHQNMNVDNAYFWRTEDGTLDLGVFDWGGMGAMSAGHKLWWWLYCGDFEPLRANLNMYIDIFVTTYRESGGPQLDEERLFSMVLITAMEQMIGLIGAIPQIMKMCPRKEWESIKDRYDPRISENIDNKSTLRLYLHCMCSIVRIIQEMGGAALLNKWVQGVWVGEMKMAPKEQSVKNPW